MRRYCCYIGYVLIGIGITIILSLILPTTVWWILFGAAMVAVGVKLIKY